MSFHKSLSFLVLFTLLSLSLSQNQGDKKLAKRAALDGFLSLIGVRHKNEFGAQRGLLNDPFSNSFFPPPLQIPPTPTNLNPSDNLYDNMRLPEGYGPDSVQYGPDGPCYVSTTTTTPTPVPTLPLCPFSALPPGIVSNGEEMDDGGGENIPGQYEGPELGNIVPNGQKIPTDQLTEDYAPPISPIDGHMIDEGGLVGKESQRPEFIPLVDKYGQPINPENFPTDANGRPIIVDKFNQPIDLDKLPLDSNGKPFVDLPLDLNGNLIDLENFPKDKSGNPITPLDQNGKPISPLNFPVDSNGRPFLPLDQNGKLIDLSHFPKNNNGFPNLVDKNGAQINPIDLPFDSNGLPFLPLDHNGNLINPQDLPLDSSGQPFLPLDQNNNPIDINKLPKNDKGNPYLQDKNKDIISPQNLPINSNGLPFIPVDKNGDVINPQNLPIDSNGQPYLPQDQNGKLIDLSKLPKNNMGNPILVDENGNEINPKVLPLNSNGLPVLPLDQNGKPINLNNLPKDSNGRPMLPIDQNGNQINPQNLPLDNNGKVFLPLDKNGKPFDLTNFPTDKNGHPKLPLDKNGKQINPQNLPLDDKGRPFIPLDQIGQPIDVNNFPKDSNGFPKLKDKNGNEIRPQDLPKTTNGLPFIPLNPNGDVINPQNLPIDRNGNPFLPQDQNGNLIDLTDLPLSSDGHPILVDHIGNIISPDNLPLNPNGLPYLPLDKNGNPIDLSNLPKDNNGHPLIPLDKNNKPIDPQTFPVDSDGRVNLPLDKNGNLIDLSKLLKDTNGHPLLPLDQNGKPINPQDLPLDKDGSVFVPLDQNGEPIDLNLLPKNTNGHPELRDKDGKIISPEFLPVDSDGRPFLPLDENGEILDLSNEPKDTNGRPIFNPINSETSPGENNKLPANQDLNPLITNHPSDLPFPSPNGLSPEDLPGAPPGKWPTFFPKDNNDPPITFIPVSPEHFPNLSKDESLTPPISNQVKPDDNLNQNIAQNKETPSNNNLNPDSSFTPDTNGGQNFDGEADKSFSNKPNILQPSPSDSKPSFFDTLFPLPSNPPQGLPTLPNIPLPDFSNLPTLPDIIGSIPQFPGTNLNNVPQIPGTNLNNVPQTPGTNLNNVPQIPGTNLNNEATDDKNMEPDESKNIEPEGAESAPVPCLAQVTQVEGVKTCAGLPPGPFIPPNYFPVDNREQQERDMDRCGITPVEPVSCTMPEVFEQLRLRVIYSLIIDSGLDLLFTQTGNYTFFAPADNAFDLLPAWFMQSLKSDKKLLVAFIMNHFIKIPLPLESLGSEFLILNARGSRLRINVYNQDTDYRIYTVDGSKVLLGGIETSTGILHIVDKVITPIPNRDHAQYLGEVPDFSSFLKAVTDAGVLESLQDENPYTIFIPYDLAFKTFDIESLTTQKALRNFVDFHIVNGTYYSAGLVHGQYLTTNFYKEIKMSVSTDGYTRFADYVNGRIRIVKPDIPVINGVAHVIDNCLIYDPNFYNYEELSEFSAEFGSFRRRSLTIGENEHEDYLVK